MLFFEASVLTFGAFGFYDHNAAGTMPNGAAMSI
jgi:hypothetical protein